LNDTAFLSVRVPETVRNRVKAIAAQRGERVQDLVNGLIERFLAEAERQPPTLAAVIGKLRAIEPSLRARGVAALFVFGSVARGEAGLDSDVDLAVEFEPGTKVSLFDLVSLNDEIEEAIGWKADVGERSALTEQAAATAERDFVRVF